MRWRQRILGLALAITCLFAGWAAPALDAAPDAEAQATLDRSVRFLQEAQNPDGGFGGRRGAPSDPGFSAWATYALAAAGINPQDQAQPGGVDVFTYLSRETDGLAETTDFDRVALVALASGTSPDSFGSVEPIATILGRQLLDGSFPQQAGGKTGWINATVWSIFPLSALDAPAAETAAQRAAGWLLGQQRPDGSWGATLPASPAEADMTGAAIQALVAAGVGEGEPVARALEFLRSRQGEDGGFREFAGGATNSASTAWVIQGIWAAGGSPREWRTASGADPLSFLASLQRGDGSIGWTASEDLNPLWMTAMAGPARALHPSAVSAAQPAEDFSHSPPRRQHGHGGVGVVEGDGVVAGGGGRGAPLFSGPQPQSRGETPHGVRQTGASAAGRAEPAAESRPHSGTGESVPGPLYGGLGQTRGQTVEGRLVSTRGPAAPGLFAADRGGERAISDLGDLLAAIAAALRVPVFLAAIAVLLLCGFELGRYGTELWRRRSRGWDLAALANAAFAEPANATAFAWKAPSGFAEEAILAIATALSRGRTADVEAALASYELAVQRRLDRTRVLVRAGPAIGLMGTLIPLAPGLESLGEGQVERLAEDLRDAFAATVIGLLVGTVAFALTLHRTRLYSEDLAALERAATPFLQAAPPAPVPVAGGLR
jgi:biopolymer transport protein ExbB/TolQ